MKLENRGGKQFTSARLFSRHAWTYGKFEARIKAPAGKHLWPAFWMFPLDSKYGIWAASGEIDIMEIRGQKLNVNQGSIHYGGSWPNQAYSGSGEKTFPHDFSKDFHTFAFEWTQTDMKWFIDGAQFHQENINKMMWSGKGTNPYSKNGQPFDQPFKFIINIAVGGTFFPENIYGPQVTLQEAKQWPKPTMEIDYVRVFKWEN